MFVLAISSLAYERVCILFNMAALQGNLAAQQPLDTEDSLKLAAKLLQVYFMFNISEIANFKLFTSSS